MKVAVLAEGQADEAAIRVLAEAVVGTLLEPLERPTLSARGWPFIRTVLPAVIRELHYNSDTDGLIVVVDADNSVVHSTHHEPPGTLDLNCRTCQLHQISRATRETLRPVSGRQQLRVAVGVAVPAIEAWYSFPTNPGASEAHWDIARRESRFAHIKNELKELVYGSAKARGVILEQRALEEAHRLTSMLDDLEVAFPAGFGGLRRDLNEWGGA